MSTLYTRFTTCITLSYSHIILKTKPALSIQNQEKHPTLHCLAQHLAQAEGSRSGETVSLRRVPPPPRRGHKIRGMSNAGSRLGETPLAWASCLLAQNVERVAWATSRVKGVWANPWLSRLGKINRYCHCFTCNNHVFRTNQAYKASSHIKSKHSFIKSVTNSRTTKATSKNWNPNFPYLV